MCVGPEDALGAADMHKKNTFESRWAESLTSTYLMTTHLLPFDFPFPLCPRFDWTARLFLPCHHRLCRLSPCPSQALPSPNSIGFDTELEEQNRTLRSAADSVAADTLEVTELVAKHQKLEAAHRELQVSHPLPLSLL